MEQKEMAVVCKKNETGKYGETMFLDNDKRQYMKFVDDSGEIIHKLECEQDKYFFCKKRKNWEMSDITNGKMILSILRGKEVTDYVCESIEKSVFLQKLITNNRIV